MARRRAHTRIDPRTGKQVHVGEHEVKTATGSRAAAGDVSAQQVKRAVAVANQPDPMTGPSPNVTAAGPGWARQVCGDHPRLHAVARSRVVVKVDGNRRHLDVSIEGDDADRFADAWRALSRADKCDPPSSPSVLLGVIGQITFSLRDSEGRPQMYGVLEATRASQPGRDYWEVVSVATADGVADGDNTRRVRDQVAHQQALSLAEEITAEHPHNPRRIARELRARACDPTLMRNVERVLVDRKLL